MRLPGGRTRTNARSERASYTRARAVVGEGGGRHDEVGEGGGGDGKVGGHAGTRVHMRRGGGGGGGNQNDHIW